LIVFAKAFLFKIFSQNSFRGSFGISLFTGRNAGRGKVTYNWISPDPVKAGPTLGVVVVVVVTSSTKQYMTNIHRKNITKDLTTIRTNQKRDKSLFKNGYLVSLFEPLKTTPSGMHLGGNLKLVNERYRSHIGATTSIYNKLTHLASNGTSSVEDLLLLTKFKREPLWHGGLFGSLIALKHLE